MEAFRENPKRKTEGFEVIHLDVSRITLKKRSEFRFFTTKLRQRNVVYKQGFPFKVIVEYQGKLVYIRTSQEAKIFLTKLEVRGQTLE